MVSTLCGNEDLSLVVQSTSPKVRPWCQFHPTQPRLSRATLRSFTSATLMDPGGAILMWLGGACAGKDLRNILDMKNIDVGHCLHGCLSPCLSVTIFKFLDSRNPPGLVLRLWGGVVREWHLHLDRTRKRGGQGFKFPNQAELRNSSSCSPILDGTLIS